MGQGPLYRVPFRRRLEGKTDYRSRLALLKSEKARVVVRRSLNNFTVQFVTFDPTGDKVVAQATAKELAKLGWTRHAGSTPAAYLTGLLAGTRAKQAGVEEGVLDLGRQAPVRGSSVFAALAGVVEAGLEVPHGDDVLPADERLQGQHINPEAAAAFAATFEKIAGRAPPAPKPKAKPKGGGGKGAPAAPPAKGGKGGQPAKPKGAAEPKGEGKAAKKAKTTE